MLSNWLYFFSALVCIIIIFIKNQPSQMILLTLCQGTLTQGKQYHLGWLIFDEDDDDAN